VTVTICQDSGKLATPFCPRTSEIEVPADLAPTSKCKLHGPPTNTPGPTSVPPEDVGKELEKEAATGTSTTEAAVPDGDVQW